MNAITQAKNVGVLLFSTPAGRPRAKNARELFRQHRSSDHRPSILVAVLWLLAFAGWVIGALAALRP